MLAEEFHELFGDHQGESISPVVVVSERHIRLAFVLEAYSKASFVTYHTHLSELDGGERIGNDGKARYARSPGAHHVPVMQGHLECLVVIFVVHIVYDLECIDIDLREPAHHLLELVHHVVIFKIIACHRGICRGNLLAANLVAAAVDGVEQALGEVRAGTEELHLLPYAHRGDAAGYAVVVAIFNAHEVVVLVLDCAGLYGYLRAVALPGLRQTLRPEDGKVRLRGRSEVLEGVEHAEAGLCHEGASVYAHTAFGCGHPYRVAGEEVVVLRSPEEADDAELDHHLVNEFLRLLLGQHPFLEVSFNEYVEEGADAAYGHCGAVLVLDCGEVGEVDELHRLTGVLRRPGHVETVGCAHLHEVLQGVYLLADFLALPYAFFRNFLDIKSVEEAFLLFYEVVHTVECHSSVIADYASPAVCVRKTGDDVGVPCGPDVCGICRKDAFVVGLAVLCVYLLGRRVEFVAICLER